MQSEGYCREAIQLAQGSTRPPVAFDVDVTDATYDDLVATQDDSGSLPPKVLDGQGTVTVNNIDHGKSDNGTFTQNVNYGLTSDANHLCQFTYGWYSSFGSSGACQATVNCGSGNTNECVVKTSLGNITCMATVDQITTTNSNCAFHFCVAADGHDCPNAPSAWRNNAYSATPIKGVKP